MKAEQGIAFGVFDLFHVGHLRYLQHAAGLCSRLWVGIRGDVLVTPGKSLTPVFSENHRCEIIAALDCVAHAFVFYSSLDDSRYWSDWLDERAIGLVVVGKDWEGSRRWSILKPLFERQGIRVTFAPRTEGISTSMIRQRLSMM